MSEQIEQLPAADGEPVVQPATPLAVGDVLRNAREAAGLPVADIALTLKLGQRQVEALERGDWAALPGHTFTRGFVRNYARLLQLDPLPLMQALDAVLTKPVDTLTVPETSPEAMSGSSRPRDRLVVAFGGVLLLVALAAYFLLPNDLLALREGMQSLLDGLARQEAPAAPAATPAEPAFPPGSNAQQVMTPQVPAEPAASVDAAAAAQVPPTASSPVAPVPAVDGAPLLKFVVSQESWVEVRDRDGNVVFSQRLPAGSEPSVSGKAPLSVTVGFAPGVKVLLRGQPVDLQPYARGDVARLILE